MSKTDTIAEDIILSINLGESIDSIKQRIGGSKSDWSRYSSKAYLLSLRRATKQRKIDESNPNTITTSNAEIQTILRLNEILADYGLLLPTISTIAELKKIDALAVSLPNSESEIFQIIGSITMHPKLRVLQKKGRFIHFDYFTTFSKLIDAATLSYYRTNFISCYLTLVPIIEGIIIRWMGYSPTDEKPKFEDIKIFFKNSEFRQPCPMSILFHQVYAKACDKILNEHFYKSSTNGNSYADFNRHVAAHLLNDNQFATKENCIRLFVLLDAMTEIYYYESHKPDPRFYLRDEDTEKETLLLAETFLGNAEKTPEQEILGTSIIDLIK